MNLLPWSPTLKIIACSFHSVAIACTIFRLIYRWHLARFWWEDGWAAFALPVDVLCLVAIWLEAPVRAQGLPPIKKIANWIAPLGFTCVLWACRISILFSIVRIANPSQQLRRIAFFICCSFIVMWAALIGQKIQICLKNSCCEVTALVGLSQLITDVISDLVLVVLPIYLLRQTKINHRQRIMILSVFSASLLITVVTILHSSVLFTVQSDGIVVISHVKTALALIVCNLLVIVAFIYRKCRQGKAGDLGMMDEVISFTSVDLNTGLTESAVDKRTTMISQPSTGSQRSRLTIGSSDSEEKTEEGTGSRSVQ